MRINTLNSSQVRARSIAPGDYPQVQQDLQAFPQPVLDLLDGYGVKVAILDEGETLEMSPALRHLTESDYQSEILRAREITKQQMSETEATTLVDFAENATRELRKAGLEFHYGVTNKISRRSISPIGRRNSKS